MRSPFSSVTRLLGLGVWLVVLGVWMAPSRPAWAQAAAPVGFANDVAVAIEGPPPPQAPEVVSRDAEGRVTVRAVELPEALVIDGSLDEAVYGRVPAVGDFVQQEPDEGAIATERTEVWIFFDERTFYVSARCWDSHPERMVANEMRRDNRAISQNENVTVLLDTFYDRRNGFFFQTNPLGALHDGLVTDEQNFNADWNTVWHVRTDRFDQGWTVEMAIPFKSLRYRESGEQLWGINVRRGVQWKNEDSYLSPVPRSASFMGQYRVSSAATLVGVRVGSRSRNLELKPFAISGVTGERNDAQILTNDLTGDAGFDVKYGVTQGLTADFTVNTDFAQVEDDEQQINLTRFSLFFPEKREFFLEGQGIFSFGGAASGRGGGGQGGGESPILFFSRSIGLSEGEAIPIRAGGRLSGRVGPYTVGLLNIQTGESLDAGALATNFTVVRLRRDIFRRSTIGVMGTNRSVSMEGPGSNQAYGVDAALSFFQNLNINAYYAETRTPGRTGDERSYRAQIQNLGDRYGFMYEHVLVGEGFNPEVGFVRRENFRRNRGELQFSPRPASIPAIRRFIFLGGIDYVTGASTGTLETRLFEGRVSIEFENTDRFIVSLRDNYEFFPEPFEITDGVVLPVDGYRYRTLWTMYGFGPQRRVSGRLAFGTGGFLSGDRTHTDFEGRIEASAKLSIEPRLQLNWVDLPQGTFTSRLVGSRITYTMSPRIFVGALLQYNSSSGAITANVRMRWEYEPGSDLFIVYTEGRDTEIRGFPQVTNRGLVIKLTKLWRF